MLRNPAALTGRLGHPPANAAIGSALGAFFLGSSAVPAAAVPKVAMAAPRLRATDGWHVTSIHGSSVTVYEYDPSGRLVFVSEFPVPQEHESKSG